MRRPSPGALRGATLSHRTRELGTIDKQALRKVVQDEH